MIKRAKTIAEERGLPLAVLTYDHHPKLVYAKLSADENKYLTTRQRKLDLFEKLGVDIVYMVNFTSQFSALKPQEFVDEYLMGFHAQVVVAGFDHTYGPKDIATMARLPEYAQERFEIVTVGEQEIDHQKSVPVGFGAILPMATSKRSMSCWATIIKRLAPLFTVKRAVARLVFQPRMSVMTSTIGCPQLGCT